jgi:23S rRNA pseudouridine2457 synthase
MSSLSYFAIYKPYGMLSQFTGEQGQSSLMNLDFDFPKDVYPIGRLDADSEGLLLLTNERRLTARLLDPLAGHEREYWVQVEGQVTNEALLKLSASLPISINGKVHQTLPCMARKIDRPDSLPDRNPPVRFRKTVPDEWISLALKEGKNRQVRRMTAAVGLPTLRLIRYRIGKLVLPGWIAGQVTPLDRSLFLRSMS